MRQIKKEMNGKKWNDSGERNRVNENEKKAKHQTVSGLKYHR